MHVADVIHRGRSIWGNLTVVVSGRRFRGFDRLQDRFKGRKGLEIGGPSRIFGPHHLLPVYPLAAQIDGCNFAGKTLWTKRSDEKRRFGHQFVAEATSLPTVRDGEYDFVLSSHVLEHTANPLKALVEWKRVLKRSGVLVLVVPSKHNTFDRKRPLTTFEHILDDFRCQRGEDDRTHIPENLALATEPAVRDMLMNNHQHRIMHHHVFSEEVLASMFAFLEMQVLEIGFEKPWHLIAIAQRA